MEDKTYFSYLLRIWQLRRGNELVWMASLDDPHTGKRYSFTSLEKLFAFLLKQTQETDPLTEEQGDQGQPAEGKTQNEKHLKPERRCNSKNRRPG